MSKIQYFTPGKKANSYKLIQYAAVYNNIIENNNQNQKICYCYTGNNDKFDSQQFNSNISTNMRIAQLLKNNYNGRIHFGNYYLGINNNQNYMGTFNGQPGGSGMPLRNKF